LKQLVYIITGTNKGLGAAFVKEIIFSKPDAIIISVGRRLNNEQIKYLESKSSNFYFSKTDLNKLRSIAKTLNLHYRIISNADNLIFINNAGTVFPIEKIGSLNEKELIESTNVNALAPSIITNYLLQHCSSKAIIFLNITSGAAEKPIAGWATYCSGKAYSKMFFSVLQEQVKENSRIKVYQIDPGTMDTEMQHAIRNSNPAVFPRQKNFIELKQSEKLSIPQEIAKKILGQIEFE